MSLFDWREEPIRKTHRRDAFDCGDPDLNRFLQRFARQSHEAGGAKTFLAVEPGSEAILGFYSLAPATLAFDRTPLVVSRGLARHEVPGFRLARLATDLSVQGRGLGAQLFVAAGRRCLRAAAEVGGVMLVIDAKNPRAGAWYEALGAIPLTDSPLTLVFPLSALRTGLETAGKL